MEMVYLKSKATGEYLTMGDYETPLVIAGSKTNAKPMTESMAFAYAAMDDDIELEEIQKEEKK